MAAPLPWLTFQQPAVFESRVFRAVAGGAAAGTLHLVVAAFGTAHPLPWQLTLFPAVEVDAAFPFAGVALAGALAAAWPGAGRARTWETLLAVGLIFLPGLLGVHAGWRLALGALAAGAFWMRAYLRQRDTAWSGPTQDSWGRRLFTGAVLATVAVIGARVASLLGQAAEAWSTPALLLAAMGGGVMGLFAGLGTAPAHLTSALDPVEAELEGLLPRLTGELAEAARRALDGYRHCARILAQLPAESGRAELAQTLTRATQEVAKLANEWSGLEALLAEVKTDAVEGQINALRSRAQASRDAFARRQLEAAAAALEDGRERVRLLVEQRERVHAKLHTGVALIESARLTLLGTRGGETQVKAAQLAGVSERLKALVSVQGEDARWVDAMATGAELAAVESRERV